MSEFAQGFAARLDAAARVRHEENGRATRDFTAVDPRKRAAGPRHDVRPSARADAATGFVRQPVAASRTAPVDWTGEAGQGWDATDFAETAPPDYADPLEAARLEGYTAGFAAGHAQAELDQQRDQALLDRLTEALRACERVDRDRLAARLRQTVLALVGRIVEETGVAADLLARRIDAAAELLGDGVEARVLRVNPADLTLLGNKLPTTLTTVGDHGVALGSFVLESPSTLVEDGPDLWLDQLTQAIDRVAVPAGGA